MDKDDIISTLNDLIETCKDGEAGFRSCAAEIRDTQTKSFLESRAQTCAAAAGELQGLVISYGGDPETGSSLSGALHRRWIDIKSAVTGHDDHAILAECERGEDIAVKSYRNALEKVLPAEVRNVVERQYQGVLRNHDQVKALRDQLQVSRNLNR
ncbi:MAG TPA: PA2169 family four-helix-bundle protein [Paucimonas sp.]|nr:PA2169 family four-helix-bundle protein [Paucimonas sp.]